jgi:hypothetical protein
VKRHKVTGDWKKIHNEELIICAPTNVTYLPKIIGIIIIIIICDICNSR